LNAAAKLWFFLFPGRKSAGFFMMVRDEHRSQT
jgi:hypothetical protein